MSRKTVLHVEDDPNDVLLFQHACQKAGVPLEVQEVGDGDEALAYLRGTDRFGDRLQYPFPRVVLLDLKMPRVNGFEVLTWMRGDEKLRRLPVIVLTSSNHDEDLKRAYAAGANSYLVKPLDFNSLVTLAKAVHEYWLTLNEWPQEGE
jgi:CheY-like chemotaxis protein